MMSRDTGAISLGPRRWRLKTKAIPCFLVNQELMAARACGVLQHEFFPILWPDPDEMALSEKFRIPNTSRFAKLRIGGTMKNIIKRIAGLACVASFAWAGAALAETYPSRPIIMVVPFAAGGPTDTLDCIVADGMAPAPGQT